MRNHVFPGKPWCVVAALVLAVLCTSELEAVTLFRDDFSGGLDPAWTIVNNDPDYYSFSPETLNLRANSGDMWEGMTNYKNLFLIDNPTSEDFVITMKVDSFQPTVDYTQITVLAWDDQDNHVRNAYGYNPGGRHLQHAVEVGGSFAGQESEVDFGSSPFWLRMTKTGTTYSQHYSVNGLEFFPSGATAIEYGDGTPAMLGFVAQVDPNENTQAVIDYVVMDAAPTPGTAYFSVRGSFAAEPEGDNDVQNFSFVLASDVRSDQPFELRTWHNGGSVDNPQGTTTNAAGEPIPAGGFDSVLRLFDGAGEVAWNVNGPTLPSLDSLIDHDTADVPDPLPARNYRLWLEALGGDLAGRDREWAVDLVGPSQSIVLSGMSNAGTDSSVSSLRFGTTDTGTATLDVGPGESLSMSGELSVAQTGNGVMSITGGGTVSDYYGYIGSETGSSGTVTVDGAGSTWSGSGLSVGNWGTGALTITDGAVVSNQWAYVGYSSGSSGAVTVSGDGSTWTNRDVLYVGNSGTGTLEVTNAGTVSNTYGAVGFENGSSGAVTVSGIGSTWTNTADLIVGYNLAGEAGTTSTGTLSITGGGAVSNTYGYVGYYAGSDAAVTVSGAGSTWTNSARLEVGGGGRGTLDITNGGAVSNTGGYIGNFLVSTGAVTVSGPGSTWTNSDVLQVATWGPATLEVTNGGTVSNTEGYIGYENGSSGAVTVSSAGSTWTNSGFLTVGKRGEGTLTIRNGGRVSSNSAANIASGIGGRGTVTVEGNGSRLDVGSTLYLANASGARQATLTIRDGGVVSSQGASVACCGPGPVATVLVEGANSRWTIGGVFSLGMSGQATLTIRDGGRVEGSVAYLGGNNTGSGNGNVSLDHGSWVLSDSLYVGGVDNAAAGSSSTHVVNVGRGAILDVARTLRIWDPGTVNLNGGTINTAALVLAGSTFNFNAGTLHFTGDLIVDTALVAGALAPTAAVSAGRHLSVAGTTLLLDTLTIDGGTFSTASLVDASRLRLSSGTFNLTSDDLTVGLGGLFGRILTVTADQVYNISNTATVTASGRLIVQGGAFSAVDLFNRGQIELGGGGSLIGGTPGSVLTNLAFVSGGGTIAALLNNEATGQLSVGTGEQLVATGGSISSGNINVGSIIIDGGTMELAYGLENVGQVNVTNGTFRAGWTVNNRATGYISGQGTVTLRFEVGLDNTGTVGLDAATANLFGDINNNAEGLIALAGASTATFVGELVNNGDVYIGPGSQAVFLSRVSGAGNFPGGGSAEFVDGFLPGNSPAVIRFGGDVRLAGSAELEIELAGSDQGGQYVNDRLVVANRATLGGRLSLVALQGYDTIGDHAPAIVTIEPGGQDIDTRFDSEPAPYDPAGYADSHLGYGLFFQGMDYGPRAVGVNVFQAIAGDANGDRAFNFADLIAIFGQSGAVYGNPAPPPEQAPDWLGGDFTADAAFTFADLIKAFGDAGAHYGAPQYPTAALEPPGAGAVSLLYDRATGQLSIDAGDVELAALSIESAGGLLELTPEADALLGGFADVANAGQFAKLDLSGMSELDFGQALATMLSQSDLLADLTVTGALLGGGAIEDVKLAVTPVPEPGAVWMLLVALASVPVWLRRKR